MPLPEEPNHQEKTFGLLVRGDPTQQEKQIQELQAQLESERDGRQEDRFVGLVLLIALLDVVFFSVMPTFGGPLALLVLELLILIPLARRMGMEEIAQILNSVLHRLAGKTSENG